MRRELAVKGFIVHNISPDPFDINHRRSCQRSKQTYPFSLCSRQEQGLLGYIEAIVMMPARPMMVRKPRVWVSRGTEVSADRSRRFNWNMTRRYRQKYRLMTLHCSGACAVVPVQHRGNCLELDPAFLFGQQRCNICIISGSHLKSWRSRDKTPNLRSRDTSLDL
jgi:hypothetical protein